MPGCADPGILACAARSACADLHGDLPAGRPRATRSGAPGRCAEAHPGVVRPIPAALGSASMFGIHDYWLFIGTGILLNLTPGQDTMFIIGRTLTGGPRAGVASAFGIMV